MSERRTITLTGKFDASEAVEVSAWMIGQHWAIAEKWRRDGWALTHVPTGAVDGRAHWDGLTAERLAESTRVPGGLDVDTLPKQEVLRPWADEVLAAGDAMKIATAGERLRPKLDGLRLFRVEIEQTREATVYVLAKSYKAAETLARDVDVCWGEADYSESGYEADAASIPSYAMGDDVVSPKGLPSMSVGEALAALAPAPEAP